MIVPNIPESRILDELIFDSKIMANEARKIAKKAILRQQKKGGDGLDEDIDFAYDYTTTKNKNKWRLFVCVNMAKRPMWYHRTTEC